ncbi:hypothetical protein GCM10010171_39390 [Actinokineospora fastidiosa]|uniref:Uncharacterized protein n=1 Tax=Actinokineospora fastidiosa TaxID=1816 RepID=A0A918LFN0_9PSEU|nr:hypothetical protein GCM10010171_39390 [Actinokineospora fastidiosa]
MRTSRTSHLPIGVIPGQYRINTLAGVRFTCPGGRGAGVVFVVRVAKVFGCGHNGIRVTPRTCQRAAGASGT